MLCEVDRSYIEDSFNLYGLRHHFPNFQECLNIILDKSAAEECRDPKVAQSAFMLYGLIHARFIVTTRGLDAMLKKYRLAEFGRCPRMLCRDQPVLPVGIADEPKRAPVKLYCPRCCEVYVAPAGPHGEEPLDGAFFGTSFAHLFIMSFDRWMPADVTRDSYTPRIFGFKIHGSARCMQRRQQVPAGGNSATAALAAATASAVAALASAPPQREQPRPPGGGSSGTAAAAAAGQAGNLLAAASAAASGASAADRESGRESAAGVLLQALASATASVSSGAGGGTISHLSQVQGHSGERPSAPAGSNRGVSNGGGGGGGGPDVSSSSMSSGAQAHASSNTYTPTTAGASGGSQKDSSRGRQQQQQQQQAGDVGGAAAAATAAKGGSGDRQDARKSGSSNKGRRVSSQSKSASDSSRPRQSASKSQSADAPTSGLSTDKAAAPTPRKNPVGAVKASEAGGGAVEQGIVQGGSGRRGGGSSGSTRVAAHSKTSAASDAPSSSSAQQPRSAHGPQSPKGSGSGTTAGGGGVGHTAVNSHTAVMLPGHATHHHQQQQQQQDIVRDRDRPASAGGGGGGGTMARPDSAEHTPHTTPGMATSSSTEQLVQLPGFQRDILAKRKSTAANSTPSDDTGQHRFHTGDGLAVGSNAAVDAAAGYTSGAHGLNAIAEAATAASTGDMRKRPRLESSQQHRQPQPAPPSAESLDT